jgi:ADP-dependent NAD(P)H-hydrate dehydratase / NAD(P)H-hydrate epimerase
MEILTGTEMRNVDRRTIDEVGITSMTLMHAAGRGVADALLEELGREAARGVVILCGKGNNGGDGFVAARQLGRHEIRGDARTALEEARADGVDVTTVDQESDWSTAAPALDRAGVVVDAILGTGIRGAVRGFLARVIDDLNRGRVPVVAIDVPSGVDADRSDVVGPVVRATRTYTLCRPKPPLVLDPAAEFAGTWRVVPIGIPDAVVRAERSALEWLDGDTVRALVPRRAPGSHKGTHGHLLAVAGARGRTGAAVLVARAALRSGAGLVTVATPRTSLPVVAVQQAEVMTEPLPETRSGAIGRAASRAILRLLSTRTALAIGPGLGTAAEARASVLEVLARQDRPAVVDADALNALAAAGRAQRVRLRSSGHRLVLTPHPGEAGRLLGRSAADVQRDRLASAREIARETGATVVLKGHRTIVATPDGQASINASGNPGLATAGTGDVLTGIVGAFLGRGLAPRDAARAAVFLHGDAGDRAAAEIGTDGMIASDVVDRLPTAIAALGA